MFTVHLAIRRRAYHREVLEWSVEIVRHPTKHYERLPESSEVFIYAVMSRLMARRLARS
jgi:hypothetical protein